MDELDCFKQQDSLSQLTDVEKILQQQLPDPVLQQLRSYAEMQGWNVLQVVEFALASFLDRDILSFAPLQDIQTPGQLKEELACLNIQLNATRKALAEAGIPDPTFKIES